MDRTISVNVELLVGASHDETITEEQLREDVPEWVENGLSGIIGYREDGGGPIQFLEIEDYSILGTNLHEPGEEDE